MTVDSAAIAVISGLSGLIGAGLFMRAKLKETEDSLKKHLTEDGTLHTIVLDRLARVETKIDILLDRET